jgi:hypothetical protein
MHNGDNVALFLAVNGYMVRTVRWEAPEKPEGWPGEQGHPNVLMAQSLMDSIRAEAKVTRMIHYEREAAVKAFGAALAPLACVPGAMLSDVPGMAPMDGPVMPWCSAIKVEGGFHLEVCQDDPDRAPGVYPQANNREEARKLRARAHRHEHYLFRTLAELLTVMDAKLPGVATTAQVGGEGGLKIPPYVAKLVAQIDAVTK